MKNTENSIDSSFDIDEYLMSAFSKIEMPSISILPLNNISEINGVVNKIRQLRVGPIIKIGDKQNEQFHSTQFKAYFCEEGTRYAEQLYINVTKCSSYKDMFALLNATLFNNLYREKGAIEVNKINEAIQNQLSYFDRILQDYKEEIKADTEASNERLFLPFKRVEIEHINIEELATSIKAKCLLELNIYETKLLEAKEILSDQINNLLKNELEEIDETKLEDVKILKNRIVMIWFLAECFRYPPMLFYSLLTLHNCLNGYITFKDIEKRIQEITNEEKDSVNHISVASSKGAQRLLCLSFQKFSGKNLNSIEQSELDYFNRGKMKILQILYNNLKMNYKTKNFEQEINETSINLFKTCLNHYSKLCGINDKEITTEQAKSLIREIQSYEDKSKLAIVHSLSRRYAPKLVG